MEKSFPFLPMALNSFKKRDFARVLRKKSTHTETMVWHRIRDRRFLGLKFRRQQIIRGFVVDFYCDELKLALEIDGKIHDGQKEYDSLRQHLIEEFGIEFLRVTTDKVQKSLEGFLDKIRDLAAKKPSPHPSPVRADGWERGKG